MTSYVYLIRGSIDQYKIGRTHDIPKRLRQLKTACPNAKLIHYWKVEDNHSWEKRLHKMLWKHRLSHRHEWFIFSDVEIEIIKTLTP